jgi:hypothetical protein
MSHTGAEATDLRTEWNRSVRGAGARAGACSHAVEAPPLGRAQRRRRGVGAVETP